MIPGLLWMAISDAPWVPVPRGGPGSAMVCGARSCPEPLADPQENRGAWNRLCDLARPYRACGPSSQPVPRATAVC